MLLYITLMQRFFSKILSKQNVKNEVDMYIQGYLTGQILIASPFMEDARFIHSVIYLCGHDENGAMGFILNKPISSVKFHDLLDQLHIPHTKEYEAFPVLYGGPMEAGRGFVLHSTEYHHPATVKINHDFSITATLEILKEIASTHGPKNSLLALGYTGWNKGQLEKELQENQWFVVKGSKQLVYDTAIDGMWNKAYESLGVDPHILVNEGGRA